MIPEQAELLTWVNRGDRVALSLSELGTPYGKRFGHRRGVVTGVDGQWCNVRWDGVKQTAMYFCTDVMLESDIRPAAAAEIQRGPIIT
jgi:hypothetical protein